MKYICCFILSWVAWSPAGSQPVLTITDARMDNPIAPYAYFLEDYSGKLTFDEVIQLPADSFRTYSSKEPFDHATPSSAVWLRFGIKNLTADELLLKTLQSSYNQLDVYVLDEAGRLTLYQVGAEHSVKNRLAPTAHPIISLGKHPRWVYLVTKRTIFNEYLRVSSVGHTILERKKTGFWQGLVVGTYLLLLVYAVVFWIRLRLSVLGWYALFLFTNIHWFLHRSGYFYEFLGDDSAYFQFTVFYPLRFVVSACWAVFHIKVLHLKRYSRLLYYLLVGWLCVDAVNHVIASISTIWGAQFAPLDELLSRIGIDWVGKLIIILSLMLMSLAYVSLKNFREVRWYTLAFGVGISAMLVSMFSLYHFSWLPFYPYNYLFVFGSVLEMIILAYALAEQVSGHRRQQHQTQQALITQLEENLRQRDKLLRIRDEIARDLHDEVGATLTSIAISAKLVQKKVADKQVDLEPILAQIKADSEETIHNIRDTVWALNPDNDAPAKFLERLRTVALQMLAHQGLTLNFDCAVNPELLLPFSMEQRRNLYLVYKEALHNIVKHAQASKVSIQIGQVEGRLQIRISDNGQGFDPAAQAEGNGLINFQKRALEGGFAFQLQSIAGTGTTLLVQVPLQKADVVASTPTLSL